MSVKSVQFTVARTGVCDSFVSGRQEVSGQPEPQECMSRVLSQTQNSFEKSLAKITLADLVGQILEKPH